MCLARLNGRRILIVQPAPTPCEEVRRQFETNGATVLGPLVGFEVARRTVELEVPDAAIIDLNFPTAAAFWFDELFSAFQMPYVFASSEIQVAGRPLIGFHWSMMLSK